MLGGKFGNVDRFFSSLEWRWSLANLFWGIGALGSVVLPAWAVKTMELFASYSPLSWVLAGFIGLVLWCACFLVYAVAHTLYVKSRFNARSMNSGQFVDPMAKIFERKRVFLNDFCLPTSPVIQDKVFVDCEIIGPANIFLAIGNRVDEILLPNCDAVVLPPNASFANGYTLFNTSFRRCSFQRVTFFLSEQEYQHVKHLRWLNWISYLPDSELPLLSQAGQNPAIDHQPPEDTAEEKQP